FPSVTIANFPSSLHKSSSYLPVAFSPLNVITVLVTCATSFPSLFTMSQTYEDAAARLFFHGSGVGFVVGHEFSYDFMPQPVAKDLQLSYRDSWRPPTHRDSRMELKGWPTCHTTNARHPYAHRQGR